MISPAPFRYLIGPVLSRRIGRSLGVDILRGECTFLCPYCEVHVHHVKNLRLFPFTQTSALFAEYKTFCRTHKPAEIHSVTFSGAGEPTLISNLGEILKTFRSIGPYPLTVITNGSLLWIPAVRKNLSQADLVIPSLDAVTESAWRRINRPHPDMTLDRYLSGTKKFCAEYRGRIWMEVLLTRGINDKPDDIDALGRFLKCLRLDRVQVGTVDRPPARSRARPLTPASLKLISRRLADLSGHRVDLIVRGKKVAIAPPRVASSSSDPATWREKILRSVRLRPQTLAELSRLLSAPKPVLTRAVRDLESAGRLTVVRFQNRPFLQAAESPSHAA